MLKKILLSSLFLVNSLFAEVLLYDNLYYKQLIENTDLKDFQLIDGSKYKLGEGIVYEKLTKYENEVAKQILKFNKNKELEIVFFFKQNKKLDIEDLLKLPKTEKRIKFIGGTISFNGEVKTYDIDSSEIMKENLSSLLIDMNSPIENILVTTTKFVEENKDEKNSENKIDNYTGVGKLKTCKNITSHQNCVKCEYIDGMEKELDCSNIYIYHPIFK